jgi:hypothetical protein
MSDGEKFKLDKSEIRELSQVIVDLWDFLERGRQNLVLKDEVDVFFKKANERMDYFEKKLELRLAEEKAGEDPDSG